jgi:hypothetical protein
MASHRSRRPHLNPAEIGYLLDADDDNASDLDLDGVDLEDELGAEEVMVEHVFNAAGEVIETIFPRHFTVDVGS